MLKNHRKTTTILLTSGIAILLSACQANTTANKPSPQESLESTSIEQNTTEQTSIIVSDVTEQITVYAGPGTDYLSIETIDKNIIEKQLKLSPTGQKLNIKEKGDMFLKKMFLNYAQMISFGLSIVWRRTRSPIQSMKKLIQK